VSNADSDVSFVSPRRCARRLTQRRRTGTTRYRETNKRITINCRDSNGTRPTVVRSRALCETKARVRRLHHVANKCDHTRLNVFGAFPSPLTSPPYGGPAGPTRRVSIGICESITHDRVLKSGKYNNVCEPATTGRYARSLIGTAYGQRFSC